MNSKNSKSPQHKRHASKKNAAAAEYAQMNRKNVCTAITKCLNSQNFDKILNLSFEEEVFKV